jgi:membrane-bound serine protease (ClpP class)
MRRNTRIRTRPHLQNLFGARRAITTSGSPGAKRKLTLSRIALCAVALIFVLPFALSSSRADKALPAQQTVLHLKIDSEIEPILATYLDKGIDEASRRNASLILITMDTPGGLSSSMENIVQHILNSKVPVAVYVSPTGSRAASAGFYILLSADVAAMAPGTHTGAASPVMIVGGYAMAIDETMRKKINNDALAFLRSYADKRNRNPVLAATAIADAKAFTEKEALDGKMIDVVASSEDDLLRQLNGREITRFDGTKVTLALGNPSRTDFELSARQKFLSRIVAPDMFFLLLIVGVLGLYTEFTHPGVVAPGVIGGICLVLALYAMQILPVNVAGIFLILLALSLFILEAKFTSHGVLAGGGIVSMLLGALFLIRSPYTAGGVSLATAVAVTLPFAALTVLLMRLVLRSRKWKQATGPEEMIGTEGVVIEPVGNGSDGMIRIHGELWRATSTQPVAEGKSVRVLRIDGLKLYVEPSDSPASAM